MGAELTPLPDFLFSKGDIMGGFIDSVSAVLVVMLLTGTGVLMGRLGWMGLEVKLFIGRFMTCIAIPMMCVYNFQTSFTRELLSGSGSYMAIPAACMAAMLLLSLAIARIIGIPRRRLGVYVAMCSLSNSIFIGYPMCMELFGEAANSYIMLYYLCNTTFLYVVVSGLIEYSGGSGSFSPARGLLDTLKRPPVIAIIAGFIMLLLNIRLPEVLFSFTRYMSNAVSAMGLIYSGYVIYELGWGALRPEKGIPSMLLMRFVASPLLCLLLCALFGIEGLGRSVLAAETAMPTMTQVVVLSGAYGADDGYAAKGAALSLLCSFAVIPILMALL